MANELAHKTQGVSLTQAEFENIDGHELASQATGDVVYAESATQLSGLAIGSTNAFFQVVAGVPAWVTAPIVSDNQIFALGTGSDIGVVLNSAGLAANTALAGVIVGSPPVFANAIPADSWIVGNITNDGDMAFFVATGGTSTEAFYIDGSRGGDVFGGVSGSWGLLNENASENNPTVVPDGSDDDTGIGTSIADRLSLIAGGFQMLGLTESETTANYIAAKFAAPDQTAIASVGGSSWRMIETGAESVAWSGGTGITATNGMGLFLAGITQTATVGTTVTTASTLYVQNPVAGSNITITNNYPINTEAGGFLTTAGLWTDNPSTRLKKHDILDVTPDDMKLALSKIRARSWVYNDEWGDEGRNRYGIVAEEQPDFLYGLGTQQRNVTSPSIMAGFALAGLRYHEDRIDELEGENNDLRQRITTLEAV